MIYERARWADEAHTQVIGWAANGNSETVPANHTVFRCPDDGPVAFVRNGGVIEEYEAPPAPTPSLEPWQFFAMLDLSGKRTDLEAFIDAMDEPAKTVAKSQYQHSKVYYRDNPLVLVAQQALSLTDDALDALWLQAANLSL